MENDHPVQEIITTSATTVCTGQIHLLLIHAVFKIYRLQYNAIEWKWHYNHIPKLLTPSFSHPARLRERARPSFLLFFITAYRSAVVPPSPSAPTCAPPCCRSRGPSASVGTGEMRATCSRDLQRQHTRSQNGEKEGGSMGR